MKTITLEEVLYHLSRCYEAYVIEQPISTTCVIDVASESFLEIQAEDDGLEFSWSFTRKDNPTAQVACDVLTLVAAADGDNESMSVQLRLLAPVILEAEESYCPELNKLLQLLGALNTEIRFIESNDTDNMYALQVDCESVVLSRKLAHFYGCHMNKLPDTQGFEASDAWHGKGVGNLRTLADELIRIHGGFFNLVLGTTSKKEAV